MCHGFSRLKSPIRAARYNYEIGQKTLPDGEFARLGALDAVSRGKAIVAEKGWLKAIAPMPSRGWITTLPKGPTASVRWFVPRAIIFGELFGVSAAGYSEWKGTASKR